MNTITPGLFVINLFIWSTFTCLLIGFTASWFIPASDRYDVAVSVAIGTFLLGCLVIATPPYEDSTFEDDQDEEDKDEDL